MVTMLGLLLLLIFFSPLRSDAHCLKLRNYTNRRYETPVPKRAWQKVRLLPGDYRLEFLAFTNGEQVSDSDLEALAAAEPYGANAITTTYYQPYDITIVNVAPGNRKASFVHGDFTVSTEGDWYLGVIVKPNEVPPDPEDAKAKLVYVASLTCLQTFE